MRGWTQLCSDVSWEDYGGMWAKKAKDGTWYVLKWTNLYDAMGEEDCKRDGHPQYECEVRFIDLSQIPVAERQSALRSCGLRLGAARGGLAVINEHDGDVVAAQFKEDGTPSPHLELCIVECLIQYGLGAPLETFTGDVRPLSVRANARRFAEECMRNDHLMRNRLARPVNAIGSTAAEYGKGDITSALNRGPFDTAKGIISAEESDSERVQRTGSDGRGQAALGVAPAGKDGKASR